MTKRKKRSNASRNNEVFSPLGSAKVLRKHLAEAMEAVNECPHVWEIDPIELADHGCPICAEEEKQLAAEFGHELGNGENTDA